MFLKIDNYVLLRFHKIYNILINIIIIKKFKQ